jgi:acyl-coenzyme A thioesterase 13
MNGKEEGELGIMFPELFGNLDMSGKFDDVLKKIKIDVFNTKHVMCSFIVDEACSNVNNSLHGGFSATLVDVISTLAFIARDPTKAGVSLDLNVTYMAAPKIGERVIVEARALRIGKSVGFSQVDLYREKDGELLVTGRHTKAFQQSKL